MSKCPLIARLIWIAYKLCLLARVRRERAATMLEMEWMKAIERVHCKKCGVIFDTVESYSYIIMVISTPTVSYNTQLMWYGHLIFNSVN